MNARKEILGNVRAALRESAAAVRWDEYAAARETDAVASGDTAVGGDQSRDHRRGVVVRQDVVALFGERVVERRTVVRHVAADELATVVAAMLWAREAKRVATPADLPSVWLSGLEGVRVFADTPELDHAALAESDGVITGCALAIAETGTVVLDGGRAQGRRELTLVPHHHLCVVHADQIVATVPEAVRRVDPYRPLTWLSGPSGGRALEILVVED